jgi:NADH:ubiquinone oxidoreductase subunit F (NADH-binding)
VVLVNGAEGEPLSRKDRLLMESRPHLVLDGAALAAESVAAAEVVLYMGDAHRAARDAMQRALIQRPARERRRTRLVTAPSRYVAGEESAAVHCVNEGIALPTATPPRPFERGVGGRPTLVQNVETLAHVAMIARFGDTWFRSLGRGASGTVLLTVSGAVATPGVVEVAHGTTVGDAVTAAGGLTAGASAVLVGGHFGGWMDAAAAWSTPLDGAALRNAGSSLGCGVVAVLPSHRCGVIETARTLSYLAGESARQCGPCVFGLRAIAEAVSRIAAKTAGQDDLQRATRWAAQLGGRGACRHPDGAASLLQSSLRTFEAEFRQHQEHRTCTSAHSVGLAA